jgi:hypothetical protein
MKYGVAARRRRSLQCATHPAAAKDLERVILAGRIGHDDVRTPAQRSHRPLNRLDPCPGTMQRHGDGHPVLSGHA